MISVTEKHHWNNTGKKLILKTQSDSNSLDFVVNRLFMKLFKTSNIDTVNYCRTEFQFDLPCIVLEQLLSRQITFHKITQYVLHVPNAIT